MRHIIHYFERGKVHAACGLHISRIRSMTHETFLTDCKNCLKTTTYKKAVMQ